MQPATAERLATVALARIDRAFDDRKRPSHLTDSRQLTDLEYQAVMSFDDMDWRAITFEQIERNGDAVFWFSPQAFCYFLPGILSAGLSTGRSDLNAYDALLGMLDRSPEPAYWDDFFGPRWSLLTVPELDAVMAWVAWFEAVEPDPIYASTWQRASDTLELLKMVARAPDGP